MPTGRAVPTRAVPTPVPQPGVVGRVALVTGASRGIGAAVARALDDAGARVVLVARDRDALASVAAGLANDPVVLPADLAETDAAVVDRMLAVNVRAPILLVGALVPQMAARGRAVVNLSSVSGLVGTPHRAAYAATKGATDAATRSLAMDLGPMGIRVNAVAPGVVESVDALTPLGRWATPEDVAAVVVFLASDAARFVTGETVAADGGMAHTLDLYG